MREGDPTIVPQYEPLMKRKYARAVYRQMMTGMVGCCTAVKELERMMEAQTGASYALATTSGTSALMLALWALDIPHSKRVLFPDYTFLAGANAAATLGYPVTLVDVRHSTLCMNPDLLSLELERGDVGAVIFVNHNGYVGPDVLRVHQLCRGANVPMIEDASQCMFIKGAGREGNFGVFSLSVPKIVTGGQGGVLISNDSSLMEIAKQYHDQGGGRWRRTRWHDHIGVNFKYTDIQAAYVMAQLRDCDDLLARKRRILDRYRKHIPLVDMFQDIVAFAIYRAKKPLLLMDALKKAGYQAVRYYKPVHENAPFGADEVLFPVAKGLSEELVYLPSSLNLGNRQIDEICNVILDRD